MTIQKQYLCSAIRNPSHHDRATPAVDRYLPAKYDGRSTPMALEDVLGEDQLAWVEHVACNAQCLSDIGDPKVTPCFYSHIGYFRIPRYPKKKECR